MADQTVIVHHNEMRVPGQSPWGPHEEELGSFSLVKAGRMRADDLEDILEKRMNEREGEENSGVSDLGKRVDSGTWKGNDHIHVLLLTLCDVAQTRRQFCRGLRQWYPAQTGGPLWE